MTMREAIIINKRSGRAVLEIDPIMIPIQEGWTRVAVAASDELAELFDTLTLVRNDFENVSAVWSDLTFPVRFPCPNCDDVVSLDEAELVELDNGDMITCDGCAKENH